MPSSIEMQFSFFLPYNSYLKSRAAQIGGIPLIAKCAMSGAPTDPTHPPLRLINLHVVVDAPLELSAKAPSAEAIQHTLVDGRTGSDDGLRHRGLRRPFVLRHLERLRVVDRVP